jgi:hypothetical protein
MRCELRKLDLMGVRDVIWKGIPDGKMLAADMKKIG